MTTHEFLRLAADTHVGRQAADGSFPPGHNGIYLDPETPVRNTAHVLTLLSNLLQRSAPSVEWEAAAQRALAYLLSHRTAQPGRTYECRVAPGKDRCNGVVGQAFVIEALAAAGSALGSDPARRRATELFFTHPWVPDAGLWRRVDPDGEILSFDMTFNHQLWFAAASSQLTWVPEAHERARTFLDKVARRIWLYRNGIIQHATPMGSISPTLGVDRRTVVAAMRARMSAIRSRRSLYSKSVGYQPFNLYGFALLKRSFPDDDLWSTERFGKMLQVASDSEILRQQATNDYSQCRELGGIKMAFVYETFTSDSDLVARTASTQIRRSFAITGRVVSPRSSADPNTVLARLYELSRLTHDYGIRAPVAPTT